MGMCCSNHSWLIRSKQDLMSPSSIHFALSRLDIMSIQATMASAVHRSERKPKEFIGSRFGNGSKCQRVQHLHGAVFHRRDT